MLQRALDRLDLLGQGYHRILKVARTIAGLAGAEEIEKGHVAESI